MKKRVLAILISILLMITIVPTTFANSDVTINVDGSLAGTVPAPVKSDGVLMFPFAEIFKAAGYSVETQTDSSGITATVIYTGQKFGAHSGISHYDVFDEAEENHIQTIEFGITPILIGKESVGVPLDYFNNIIGLSVSWDEASKTVNINTAASKPQNVYDIVGNYGAYLKVNDSRIFVANYEAIIEKNVDTQGTTPFVKSGTTLLPISSLITELGGKVQWDGKERKVSLELNGNRVDVWIDKTKAVVNGKQQTLNIAPITKQGRTFVPLRFVTENLGLELKWDSNNQIIILYQPWFMNEMQLDAENYSAWFTPTVEEIPPVVEPIPQPVKPQPPANTTDPLDSKGTMVHVTDIVSIGMFYGEVKQINGTKLLVYFDTKSVLVPDGDEEFWANVNGIRYKANSWIEANEVSIKSSGY